MPRQEHVFTVFVASPSDVVDERTKLEEVIGELNIMWSRELGFRLDLVRWETHTFPGVGEDAQDVINEQILDDYDLFIGIMWCRYGTPTGRSDSGTVEEFERAKARHDADSSSVKLMVYFKDEPMPPSSIDTAQLSKVNEFRRSLGKEGALYWNFTSVENFEKFIRLHLTRQVQAWKAQFRESESYAVQNESIEQPIRELEVEPEDEFGILDLIEIFEDRFAELAQISERIGKATETLGDKITKHTTELNELPHDSRGNVNRRAAKRIISRASADMDHFSVRIEAEIPLFSNTFNTGMDAIIRGVSMSANLDSAETVAEQSTETLEAIATLRETLTTTEKTTSEFRQTIAGLPPMTSELNRAKRAAVSVLDRLIAEFNGGQTLLREAETVVRDFPGGGYA